MIAEEEAPDSPPIPAPADAPRGERCCRFYFAVGALTLLLASAPYLWGYLLTPPGRIYTGFAYNIDDTAVYLSWMRQAENGHFFLRNQFAVEPQRGVLFNLFFYLLGSVVRVTHLPAVAVYHGARVICGALLLWAVAALLRETLREERARRTAFALVCVSAGLGFVWAGNGGTAEQGPVDSWQPEAITFLSLYYAPLFIAALALMAVFMRAMLRAERTGRLRDTWPAALSGALLGNFHSYDVIHLFAVWGVYRIVTDVSARRLDRRGWLRLVLVGLATLPTTAYQYWALQVEPVFFERALVSSTRSPALWQILSGYGLVAAAAFAAIMWMLFRLRRGRRLLPESTPDSPFTSRAAFRFLAVWAVVGIAIAYVPVTFQRKLLMGAHLPLCALAGVLAAQAATARLRGNLPSIALAAFVSFTIPTNLWFLQRDMDRLAANVSSTPHRPYLTRNEWDALQWLKRNTRASDAVLVGLDPTSHRRFPHFALYPHLSVYVPAFAGNVVYNGHWSETARFEEKMGRASRFFHAATPDTFRQRFLRENNIRYVLYVNALAGTALENENGAAIYRAASWSSSAPQYLRPVHANREVTVFAVGAR